MKKRQCDLRTAEHMTQEILLKKSLEVLAIQRINAIETRKIRSSFPNSFRVSKNYLSYRLRTVLLMGS